MFLKKLEEILEHVYDLEEQRFAKYQIRHLRVLLLQMIENEGFMKTIIFKHGILITIYGLKTFDSVARILARDFRFSYDTGQPPDLKASFEFNVKIFCMALDQNSRCKKDNDPCTFVKGNRWPLCQIVNQSIIDDLNIKKIGVKDVT